MVLATVGLFSSAAWREGKPEPVAKIESTTL